MTAKITQKLSKITKRKKPNGADARAVEKTAESVPETKGPRQPHLPAPGMAPSVHKDVNEAAEALGDAKERLKSAQNVKKLKEQALIFVMKKRGLTHYVDRGLNIEIILESPDRVKLKAYNHEDENDE
jgi:hypothetical protein